MKGTNGKVPPNRAKALKPGPLTALAFCNRALAHCLKNEYAKAIAAFTRAIKLDPKDAAAYSNRGAAYQLICMRSVYSIIASGDPPYRSG